MAPDPKEMMTRRYAASLTFSGTAWFFIAGVFGGAVPIFSGELWIQHLACALFTAYVVGIALKNPILYWTGWKWYVLPLITLLMATIVFGFLLPCSWLLTNTFSGDGVDGEAFILIPFIFVFYSMTYYLALLYPLAMATQCILKAARR